MDADAVGTFSVLRLGFVPGVVPHKWASRFRTRFGAEALDMGRVMPDEAVSGLRDGNLEGALMPLPVDKEVFHAIPLYVETDDESGRISGREIGLVWLKDLEHPLIEGLTGIVRGRTANSSRGQNAEPPARKAEKPIVKVTPKPKPKSKTNAEGGKNNFRSSAKSGRRPHRSR
jgi:hypothetical protein